MSKEQPPDNYIMWKEDHLRVLILFPVSCIKLFLQEYTLFIKIYYIFILFLLFSYNII